MFNENLGKLLTGSADASVHPRMPDGIARVEDAVLVPPAPFHVFALSRERVVVERTVAVGTALENHDDGRGGGAL